MSDMLSYIYSYVYSLPELTTRFTYIHNMYYTANNNYEPASHYCFGISSTVRVVKGIIKISELTVYCKELFAIVSSGFMTGSSSLCHESYKVGNYAHTYVCT